MGPGYGMMNWDLGLASEIDVDEGESTYASMRLTILGLFAGLVILMIFAILFSLELGEKANTALIRAKDQLGRKSGLEDQRIE